MRKLCVILLTLNSVAATDVAVIIGGQDAEGNSINLTEFYTENTDSCIYNEDFLAMKDIFNFQPPENDGNLAGVFVDNDAMFLCSNEGGCEFLNSLRSGAAGWQHLTQETDPDQAGDFNSYGLGIWDNGDYMGFVNFAHYMKNDETTVVTSYMYTKGEQPWLHHLSDIAVLSKIDIKLTRVTHNCILQIVLLRPGTPSGENVTSL